MMMMMRARGHDEEVRALGPGCQVRASAQPPWLVL